MLTLLAGSAGTPAAVVSAGAYRALLARFRATGTLSKRSQRMEVPGCFRPLQDRTDWQAGARVVR